MCGITGIIARSDKGRLRMSKLQQSVRTLQKRGPDDEGIYTNENVALGHRRLSIIDTSAAGRQPMWDPSGRWVILFNGEILNYQGLRDNWLTAEEKASLNSGSDTEILLKLFIKKGPDCLPLLEGFFSFAVYDTKDDHLFLVRDRFGKKPLYIYEDDDCILFASELKAIMAYEIPKKLNYNALYQYLQLSYIPQPVSILQGVRRVAPGSYTEMSPSKGIISQKQWYSIQLQQTYKNAASYDDAKETLYTLMNEAVQKRLISDVPLGAFLSGGIDSSVVVALASGHVKHFKTFSIGYKGKNFFDETRYAELVAKKYQADHTVFYLDNNDYLDAFFPALDYIDEPFADPSCLPQYILSYQTKKYATVAVSGDAGDEIFAGYNKHYAELRARRKDIISFFVRAGHSLWKTLPKNRSTKIGNLIRQLDRYAEGMKFSCKERYWRWASINTPADIDGILQPHIREKIDLQVIEAEKENILKYLNPDDFNSVLRTDTDLVLSGDMLVKVDRMSMANGLEVRSPFLDHHVVEFAFTLPAHYKIDNIHRKKIVKDTFRHLLPPELYNRPKKGFDVPMLNWFKEDLNSYLFDDLLKEETIRDQGIINYDYVVSLRNELNSATTHDTVEKIWILMVFQYWYNKYFLA